MAELRWRIESQPDPRWVEILGRTEGGFFHTPGALHVGLPSGEPLFATAHADGEPVGVAVGVRTDCRIGRGVGHVRLAALPALAADVPPADAMATLARALDRHRVAEVSFGSFGAMGEAPRLKGGVPTPPRTEFVVDLGPDPEALLASFGRSHRRHVRRGIKGGWTTTLLEGTAAADALLECQTTAAERQAERSGGFDVSRLPPEAVAMIRGSGTAQWGLRAVAGHHDGRLLSVILVGWANGRGYSLKAGSTAAGYELDVGAWFQWTVMSRLREEGLTSYNLGGTSREAASEGHPEHGLHYYKTSFGSRPVLCRGVHLPLRRGHLALHRLVSALRR